MNGNYPFPYTPFPPELSHALCLLVEPVLHHYSGLRQRFKHGDHVNMLVFRKRKERKKKKHSDRNKTERKKEKETLGRKEACNDPSI